MWSRLQEGRANLAWRAGIPEVWERSPSLLPSSLSKYQHCSREEGTAQPMFTLPCVFDRELYGNARDD